MEGKVGCLGSCLGGLWRAASVSQSIDGAVDGALWSASVVGCSKYGLVPSSELREVTAAYMYKDVYVYVCVYV